MLAATGEPQYYEAQQQSLMLGKRVIDAQQESLKLSNADFDA